MPKTIALIGALDTKGQEFAFVKQAIEERGHRTLVINTGVMEEPRLAPDIPAQAVAEAGGSTLADLRSQADRGKAIDVMAKGAAVVVKNLYEEGKIDGILGMGAGDRVRLSTIGLGTGKDVAKCLGMGRGSLAIKAIAAGKERPIDVGKVTSMGEDGAEQVRYFLLEASAGWVPEISQGTPRWLKRLGDTAPYMVMAGVKMLGPMGRQFTLTIDSNRFDGRYNSISVHNMELWGGDLVAAPGAATEIPHSVLEGRLESLRPFY